MNWRRLLCALPFSAIVLWSSLVHSEVINLTYTAATTWSDGTLLVIRSTRLICNGNRVDSHQGATGSFAPDLENGTYACVAVHTADIRPGDNQCSIVDATDPTRCVSPDSNTKQFIVGSVIIITVGSPTELEVQ